jgi:hypothetical protein
MDWDYIVPMDFHSALVVTTAVVGDAVEVVPDKRVSGPTAFPLGVAPNKGICFKCSTVHFVGFGLVVVVLVLTAIVVLRV